MVWSGSRQKDYCIEVVKFFHLGEKFSSKTSSLQVPNLPKNFKYGRPGEMLRGNLKGKIIIGDRDKGLYEFEIHKEKLKMLKHIKDVIIESLWVRSCVIDDVLVVISGGTSTPANRIVYQLLRYDGNGAMVSSFCSSPLAEDSYWCPSITNVGDHKIMVVGGTGSQSCSSGRVFEGAFNKDKTDINWKELPSLLQPRCFHKAVKMKNRLYIFGGLKVENGSSREISDSYEWYDFNSKEWFSSEYDFGPFSLANTSIVVNDDETYAVLIKGYDDKDDENKNHDCKCRYEDFCKCSGMPIMMFTEENGFTYLSTSQTKIRSSKLRQSSCHMSVKL